MGMAQLLFLLLAVGAPSAFFGFIAQREWMHHVLSLALCMFLSLVITTYLSGQNPGGAFSVVTEHDGWLRVLLAYAQVVNPLGVLAMAVGGAWGGWKMASEFQPAR